jgi:hypothetical protein
MPHWLACWEIACSKGATIELPPSVISLRKVQKNCQKRVNTRANSSACHSVSLRQQPCAHAQSIVPSRSLPSRSFSLLEVSQKCSQLIHMHFMATLASGLETRNQRRNRQEKNEFYFQSRRKNFLTKKMRRACRSEKIETACLGKFFCEPSRNAFEVAATN